MKNIKFLFLLSFLTFAVVSCDDEVRVDTGVAEGGLLESLTPIITHVQASTGTYTAELKVFQGNVKTSSVNVYKQFVGASGSSERLLHTTLNVTEQAVPSFITYDFTFPELKEGLTLNGAALPIDDELNVGDGIVLSYEANTSTGRTHRSNGTTEVAISGRFAGVYRVVESDYWRIGVQSGSANWVDETRVIKSIDATTYLHEGFGPFGISSYPDEAFFYFAIDGDLNISYYEEYPEGTVTTGLGSYLITCEGSPTDMSNVPCGGALANTGIKDDVDGKDRLVLVYGYYTEGSGSREFYEVLEKL